MIRDIIFYLVIGLSAMLQLGVVLFIKKSFPAYMTKKGENLATKQDIADITKNQESVKLEFQKQFNDYSRRENFRDDFKYRQYDLLYSKLYGIICQSEFIRCMLRDTKGKEYSFEEIPHFQIEQKREHTSINIANGQVIKNEVEEIKDDITEYNKEMLNNLILENYNLASPELMKLAVAYRYCLKNYSGGPRRQEPNSADIHLTYCNDQEVRIIREIIILVVKEYNQLRKNLDMEYSEKELETGLLDTVVYQLNR